MGSFTIPFWMCAPCGLFPASRRTRKGKECKAMNITRRICLICGICMGIVTIFLLTCGRNTPSRVLEFTSFAPFVESGVFQTLPAFSIPLRQPESRLRQRSPADGPEPGPPRLAPGGVRPVKFLSGILPLFPLFRHAHHLSKEAPLPEGAALAASACKNGRQKSATTG